MRFFQTVSLAGFAAALTIAVSGSGPASAQAVPAAPATPTTRILAIGHLTAAATPEAMRAAMPQEVRDTVRLYLSGRIEQWYGRKDKPGVVFVINSADPAEARALLEKLPLGQRGLMDFDLIPLGPLAPLGLLVGSPAK
jgi:hypothetical protein